MNSLKVSESECEGCAACCKYHFTAYLAANVGAVEYYKKRALEVYPFNDKWMVAKMSQLCPYIDIETNLCKDYQNRPEICKKYPPQWRNVWAKACSLMVKKFKPNKQMGKFKVLKIGD